MDDDTMDKMDSTAPVAERLHTRYVDELRRSLRPPVDPKVNRKHTEAMIERALADQPSCAKRRTQLPAAAGRIDRLKKAPPGCSNDS